VWEAVSKIKRFRRTGPVLAAESAVLFLEKVSLALEHVDSSSGATGTAVNRAIKELVPVIAQAPAEHFRRGEWLEGMAARRPTREIEAEKPLDISSRSSNATTSANYWAENRA
jgi:hypothetical protein